MRKRNKLAAMLLATVMVLGLAGTAFASENGGYSDISGHWGEEYIKNVVELGLIDGKTATTFAPDENMTRADLVLALYRLAQKSGKVTGSISANPFTDVPDGAKYKDAVLWASSQSIVNGTGDTTFEPNAPVERQAIAKILNGFAARLAGAEELRSSEDVLSSYPDVDQLESWAPAFMNWAVASEYISGSDGGKLDPQGNVTRAEAAAIICRYMDDSSTGDASKDDARNGNSIGEKELLVVSFGTSYNENRAATIGGIEGALEKAFTGYSVRRGFTANIIIEHVLRRDGVKIDNVQEALQRAKDNGVKELLVQPTHLMNGYEYGDLRKELEDNWADDFETIRIGAPLLTSDKDFTDVALALVEAAASFDDGKTAICYMGHGTEAAANGIYARMQEELKAAGYDNYFVGTVEAHPDVQDVLKMVQDGEYTRVVLRPMMNVAADHANNDMAGDEEGSWKTVFTEAGYEVVTEIKGLGEIEGIQQILVQHAQNAELLSETSIEKEPNPANTGSKTEEPSAPAESAELADGVYTIDVTSDSRMFRVVACELTVEGGKMSALLTLSGTGYTQMYAGTAADAEKAGSGLIDYVENAKGAYTFTVPVEALDQELAYAALGSRWFDRGLTFESATAEAK